MRVRVAAALFALGVFAAFSAYVPGYASPPRDAYVVLRALNAERASARVRPLAFDAQLSAVAQAHAYDMARRGYFSHVSPEGIDPFARMRKGHCRFRYAGENLGLAESTTRAHQVIWNDPAHRSVVLNANFGRVGIGTARARLGTILVEDFAD